MSVKNSKTTCTYIEWSKLKSLINLLQRDDEHKFALLCAIGSFCGLRISDICCLTWKLLNQSEFELQEKKTKKHRKIRFNEDLQKIIKVAHEKLKQISKKYKLGNDFKSTHVLRKSFTVAVYNRNPSNTSLMLISEVLNHRNVSTTMRYMRLKKSRF